MSIRDWWEKATPRERDAAVAEKVMGWNVLRFNNKWIGARKGHEDEESLDIPSFTSDISAAFQVVEKMRGKGFWFEFESDGPFWRASFRNGPLCDPWAVAPTASEAICLAAFLAKEEEK